MFSDNSYLSAVLLLRQGLLVAAPTEMRTKKAESTTAAARLLVQAEKEESQGRCDVPYCCYEELQATRSCLVTISLMLHRGRTPNPWRQTLPYFGTRIGKNLFFRKNTRSPDTSTTWTFLRVNNYKWIFHNLDHLLRPLESMPVSRERVVPTERQVRTLLGDSIQVKGDDSSSAS